MRVWLVLLFAWGLAAAPDETVRRLDGSTLSSRQIDETVSRLMAAAEVTGAGIAILNDGHVAYLKAYGLRDVARKLPLTEDSVMGAASLSKAAFAYLAMQMVASQALDLDKPIQQYLPKPLPEYNAYRDLAGDPRYRKITARMLLSHTAGFPNLRWLSDDRKLNINFEPGTRYAYSGEGIQLLQFVVETIAGKPVKDLMQERVFGPLGMSRTSMITEPNFADNCAIGYDEWGRPLGCQQRKSASAAGSMQTTIRDYARFLEAVLASTRLPVSARDLMLSPQVEIRSKHQFPSLSTETTGENRPIRLSYGLGWGLYWSPYGKVFFKEGHDEGFRHYAVAFEKPKTGMIVMTNSSNGEGIFQDLLETLIRDTFTPCTWEGFVRYSDLPPRVALPKHTEIAVDPSRLDRLVGRYSVPGAVLTITRQGGHLALRENEEPPGELFPESELSFFSKTSDDVVSFDLDAAGRVSQLVIHTGGRNIVVKRADY